MKKIVLDTNAYTALMMGNIKILEILAVSETVYISIFVMGELYAGFKGGNKEKENCQIFETFLKKPGVKILNATEETAQIFAFIKDLLKKPVGQSRPVQPGGHHQPPGFQRIHDPGV
ncbi:MAG: hypothetical protein ABR534_04390 [Desulfotignum sp.]|nr:hypothetical protein [Desulfobacteraceae bacterium]